MLYMNLRRNNRWDAGQGLVEYSLVLAFVAIIVIVIVAVLGDDIAAMYQRIVNATGSL